ncbi:hypothetical protein AB4299_09105, partial [Vibrio cyclitrophicus]
IYVIEFFYSNKLKIKVDLSIPFFLFLMLIVSIISGLSEFSTIYSFDDFLKFTLVVLFPFLACYIYIYREVNFLPDYYKFIFISAIVGIIQFVGAALDITWLYDFRIYGMQISNVDKVSGFLRVYSFFREPFYLGFFYIPIIYAIFYNKIYNSNLCKSNNFSDLIILIVFLLTFSSVAYVGMVIVFLSVFFVNIKFRFTTVIYFLIFSILLFLILNSQFQVVEKLFSLFDDGKLYQSGSVFAFVSNYEIIKNNLTELMFFGVGFNHYYELYDNNIYLLFDKLYMDIKLNRVDGANMANRLIGEFGVLFFFLSCVLLLTRFICNVKSPITHLYFVSLLVFSLRNGSYHEPIFLIFLSGFLISTMKSRNSFI